MLNISADMFNIMIVNKDGDCQALQKHHKSKGSSVTIRLLTSINSFVRGTDQNLDQKVTP